MHGLSNGRRGASLTQFNHWFYRHPDLLAFWIRERFFQFNCFTFAMP